MADYKKMYTELFNKVTDVIEQLQEIQRATEHLYIETSTHEINDNNRKSNEEKLDLQREANS